MGRQGGIARFLGSCRQLIGYVDDGRALWRQHGPLNRKRWRKHPKMEGQRVAARYFGAASTVAGSVWSRLPAAMRRLADGGGFNRFVGRCRDLVESDGQVWQLDALSGLNLSADSSGPLKIVGSLREGLRLTGVQDLMGQIDAALGPAAGQRSEKFLVAHRFVDDGVTRETVDYGPMGNCIGWNGKYRQGGRSGGREAYCAARQAVERRVRVWVYAVEMVDTEWSASTKRYELAWPASRNGRGFVTEWLSNTGFGDSGWAWAYDLDAQLAMPAPAVDGTNIFVVFTAVEVAEKRGRHWVRLPWCSRMQVHEVVAQAEAVAEVEGHLRWPVAYANGDCKLQSGRLVAVADRRVEGMEMRSFVLFEGEISPFWDISIEGVGVEFKGPCRELVPERELVVAGIRAGP